MVTGVEYTAYGGQVFTNIGSESIILSSPPFSSVQYLFPSGIVFPQGSSVMISNFVSSSGTIEFAYVHGYLTSN